MAAVLAIEAAEAAEGVEVAEAAEAAEVTEGGKAAESFSNDSVQNAVNKGVDVQAIGKGILGIASSVLSLVSTIRRGKEAADDIKEQRYAAGLLAKNESRLNLLSTGKIPAYYAASNIRELVANDKLPLGWSPAVLVDQGFGKEVALQQRRQRARTLARQRGEGLKRQQLINASKARLNLAEATHAANRRIAALKSSVVQ